MTGGVPWVHSEPTLQVRVSLTSYIEFTLIMILKEDLRTRNNEYWF